MIFQFFNLLEVLTVANNVLLPAQLAGLATGHGQRATIRPSRWIQTEPS